MHGSHVGLRAPERGRSRKVNGVLQSLWTKGLETAIVQGWIACAETVRTAYLQIDMKNEWYKDCGTGYQGFRKSERWLGICCGFC